MAKQTDIKQLKEELAQQEKQLEQNRKEIVKLQSKIDDHRLTLGNKVLAGQWFKRIDPDGEHFFLFLKEQKPNRSFNASLIKVYFGAANFRDGYVGKKGSELMVLPNTTTTFRIEKKHTISYQALKDDLYEMCSKLEILLKLGHDPEELLKLNKVNYALVNGEVVELIGVISFF